MTVIKPGGAGLYGDTPSQPTRTAVAPAPAPARAVAEGIKPGSTKKVTTKSKPAPKAKPAAKKRPPKKKPPPKKKGTFLLQKEGRKKNVEEKNPRKGKTYVETAGDKAGTVKHVYNIKGKRVEVVVKKKGAKAGTATSNKGGRQYKRKPKGATGGGQFSG